MEYGYLTLVAPILTLVIAIATRKVPLAMLIGIFTGQMIICGWNPFTAINEGVNGILGVCTDTGNLKTFLFTALMGAFVILVRVSGGVKGFVNYLTEQSKRVKSKRMAMLIAYVIGIIIFIDGLLSIMFTGVVTRPLTDKFKVSREKLAYICDATSAPVNAIIPLNSWGAMLMGLIAAEIASGYIQGEPMNLLVRSLPFQFYSILSLLFVLFYIVTGKDWGPMKKAELRVQTTGKLYDDGVTPLLNDTDGLEELVEEGISQVIVVTKSLHLDTLLFELIPCCCNMVDSSLSQKVIVYIETLSTSVIWNTIQYAVHCKILEHTFIVVADDFFRENVGNIL